MGLARTAQSPLESMILWLMKSCIGNKSKNKLTAHLLGDEWSVSGFDLD